jgi:hypothetical protein
MFAFVYLSTLLVESAAVHHFVSMNMKGCFFFQCQTSAKYRRRGNIRKRKTL